MERHIRTIHGAAGRTITEGQTAKVTMTAANVASATTSAQPSFLRRGKYGITQIVEERLDALVREKVTAILSSTRSNPSLRYQAYVCRECLNIEFLNSRPYPLSRHECDTLPLFDHPELVENRDDILHYLEVRLPRLVVQILKGACEGGGKILVVAESDRFMIDLEAPVVTMDQSKRYQEDPASACYTSVDLGDVNENHWAHRAIEDSITPLSEAELLDFIIRTRQTFGFFKARVRGLHQNYCMLLCLQTPASQ